MQEEDFILSEVSRMIPTEDFLNQMLVLKRLSLAGEEQPVLHVYLELLAKDPRGIDFFCGD